MPDRPYHFHLPTRRRMRRLALIVGAGWTLAVLGSLALRAHDVRDETHQAARAIARAHFDKDQVLRLWAAERGGVYVPVDDHNSPSPWLEHLPGRDVRIDDGRVLTLLDPANLVRQLASEYPEMYGITGHVTSLSPLRPENAPDPWEREALVRLHDGRTEEVTEILKDGGEPRLRLMRPMRARPECAKCHGDDMGAVGSIRGGVAVTVPLRPLYAAEQHGHRRALWMAGPLWLLGLAGLWYGSRVVGQQVERRRGAVAALQAAHDALCLEQELYRSGPVVVFRCRDEDGWPVEHVSANIVEVLGYAAEEFTSGRLRMVDVIHPAEVACVRADVARLAGDPAARPEAAPYRLCHRDGRPVWVLVNPVTREAGSDGVAKVQGYFVDVTGWQAAEVALRESEERLELALAGAGLGAWDWDLPSGRVLFDDRWTGMLGYGRDEIAPELGAWSTLVHPDDLPRVWGVLNEHLEGRSPRYRCEYRLRSKSGRWVWILDAGRVITRDSAGCALRAAGVHQDITTGKQSEAARELALARLQALIDNLQAGVLVEDAARHVVQANAAFRAIFGLEGPEIVAGADAGEILARAIALFADPEASAARAGAVLARREAVVAEELALADGRVLEGDFVPIHLDGQYAGGMWIHRDVTARKRLEREALQQERLAAVGQLSAGIAHDFNNILCSIMGFTELLQASPDMPASAQPNLRRIGDSSRRAAHLVRQVLDFSQKTRRRVQVIDLEACLRETEAFLAASLPENIRIELRIEPGSHVVEAEPAQVQQMITNLAINARDAMRDGGELRLSLSRGPAESGGGKCGLCGGSLEGEWLRIAVGDTGVGIAPEVLPRIFEPFFTTKGIGEGTGLGLSQAAGIAAQNGGHVQVRSAPGRGSTFTILLPPSRAGSPDVTPQPEPPVRGDGRRLLLVEDDLSVNEAIGAMLSHLGYEVVSTGSGREALDVFARDECRYDLVLTDIVMPDLDGEALCAALRALAPEVRVVAMSGYPLGERGDNLRDLGVNAWIQKPVTIEGLAAAVTAALARRA